jgi:hypothetical protein
MAYSIKLNNLDYSGAARYVFETDGDLYGLLSTNILGGLFF